MLPLMSSTAVAGSRRLDIEEQNAHYPHELWEIAVGLLLACGFPAVVASRCALCVSVACSGVRVVRGGGAGETAPRKENASEVLWFLAFCGDFVQDFCESG